MVRIYRKYLVSYDDRTPSANAIRMIKYFSLKVTFQANCFDIWKLFKIWPNHWPLNLAKSWRKIVEQFNSKINLKAFQSSLKMLSSGSTNICGEEGCFRFCIDFLCNDLTFYPKAPLSQSTTGPWTLELRLPPSKFCWLDFHPKNLVNKTKLKVDQISCR